MTMSNIQLGNMPPGQRVVGDPPPPPEGFSQIAKKKRRRVALPGFGVPDGANLAQLLVKNDQVRSGHGAMTS